jgi:hypothetical protein
MRERELKKESFDRKKKRKESLRKYERKRA